MAHCHMQSRRAVTRVRMSLENVCVAAAACRASASSCVSVKISSAPSTVVLDCLLCGDDRGRLATTVVDGHAVVEPIVTRGHSEAVDGTRIYFQQEAGVLAVREPIGRRLIQRRLR